MDTLLASVLRIPPAGAGEDRIEDAAERAMDRLDRRLLRGAIRTAEYEAACKALDAWVRHAR